MPPFLIEALKHVKDASEPLTLIAFLAVILLGCIWLVLRAISGFLPKQKAMPAPHFYLLCKQLVSSFFWLGLAIVVVGVGLDLAVKLYKQSLPSPPVPDEEPNRVFVVNFPSPAPAGSLSPGPAVAPPTPPPVAHQYKLIWYDHYQPNALWEVTHNARPEVAQVDNGLFHTWCVPFRESDYVVIQRNKRWLQIMDGEKWYFYEVVPKQPAPPAG